MSHAGTVSLTAKDAKAAKFGQDKALDGERSEVEK